MPLERDEIAVLECTLVRRLKDDERRFARIEGFAPSRSTHTPPIAWFQPGKAELLARRGEIVAAAFREGEEVRRYDDADGVRTAIFVARIAATAAKKACHRLLGAVGEGTAEHVARGSFHVAKLIKNSAVGSWGSHGDELGVAIGRVLHAGEREAWQLAERDFGGRVDARTVQEMAARGAAIRVGEGDVKV